MAIGNTILNVGMLEDLFADDPEAPPLILGIPVGVTVGNIE